ncbi:GNAT family N-acetyltransferase [Vulcaniibacterium tengchongense]|uniref:Ribosomal protein S18 acetylase RimI-like enzyme n=1 Tax=Vulcaniibacterium tengchongense TaxID=1273429 RepID=A0A3N4VCE2_9GAMM|nr:GNAT family N-acetyltransferase [Vulcaniibacterium tengchongense]RPE79483.1 ribosomal protein S18 acetylase RimI-like enzyme [Vulcaniibacterium tengchongense]
MQIRRAGVADAATLSRLASACFTETFGHLYPPEDLHAFLAEAYAVEAWAALLRDPAYATWVLEAPARGAVGYALAGPCGLPHPDVRAGDGELKRLYVLRDFQNGGWGGRLFRAAQDWLLAGGPRTLWIGVWSENFGAQRFYARHGYVRAGQYHFAVGKTRDLEFILRRDPDGAAAASG